MKPEGLTDRESGGVGQSAGYTNSYDQVIHRNPIERFSLISIWIGYRRLNVFIVRINHGFPEVQFRIQECSQSCSPSTCVAKTQAEHLYFQDTTTLPSESTTL